MRTFKSFTMSDAGEETAPQITVKESRGMLNIRYEFPGVYMVRKQSDVDGDTLLFTMLDLPEAGTLRESGRPAVPSFGRYVQIPANHAYAVSVKLGEPVVMEDVMVEPAQAMMMDSDVPHKYEYDEAFYKRSTPYPEDVVTVSGPFEIDGYTALLVQVRPFQAIPAKHQVKVYTKVDVSLKLRSRAGQPDSALRLQGQDQRAFGNLFLNPRRDISSLGKAKLKLPEIPILLKPVGPEFLILHGSDFKGAADKLAEWKETKDMETTVVNINDVGATVDDVKAYIRERRGLLMSRLRYVLLMGDINTIPSEPITGGFLGSNITDYYYSTQNDPENGNDYQLPWLALGRIPVQSSSDAYRVVNQIIDYEKTPPSDSEYYRRMISAAMFQGSTGTDTRGYLWTMEQIREHMVGLGFTVDRIYVADCNDPEHYHNGVEVPQAIKDAIVSSSVATDLLIQAINDGQVAFGHRDHGIESGWHEPPLLLSHLDQVETDMPSVFFSINCLTGKFDKSGTAECFAEGLLALDGGAPSLVAATRVSGTWVNHQLITGLYDSCWPGVIDTFPGSTYSYPLLHNRLGDMLAYAKTYLPTTGTSADQIKDEMEIYHVIGDPTLEVWTDEPEQFALKATLLNRQAINKKLLVALKPLPPETTMSVYLEYYPNLQPVRPRRTLLRRVSVKNHKTVLPLSLYTRPSIQKYEALLGKNHSLLGVISGAHKRRLVICVTAPGYRYRELKLEF